MSTVKYIRVSTTEQNPERQIDEKYKCYIDKISGTVPFYQRPEAKKLIRAVENGDVDKVVVHSISRLGRSTVDILNTINWFTEKGVCVKTEKEGFETLDTNGKENTTARMVISIMATLSQFERDMIRERQKEGVERARQAGKYKNNGGNRPKESDAEFINKEVPQRIINRFLNKPDEYGRVESVRTIAKLVGCSVGTVQKTKRVAKALNLWNPTPSNPNHAKLKAAFESGKLKDTDTSL